jgi:hypothetical protein
MPSLTKVSDGIFHSPRLLNFSASKLILAQREIAFLPVAADH